MPDFTYPTNEELMAIEPDLLMQLQLRDPIFGLFPIKNHDTHIISWEIRDNVTGLQAIRGLNGEPTRVKARGGKKYTMEPGVYGEYLPIDEKELTARRSYGTLGVPVAVDDLVRDSQDVLAERENDRLRYILWTLLTTGQFSVATETGVTATGDYYPIQTASASVDWDTAGSCTPIADFMAVQLLDQGHGAKFNGNSQAFMNRVTFNKIVKCTNTSDIAGKKAAGLQTIISVADVNKVLLEMDLPQIVIQDDGYYDSTNTWQKFIADDKVVFVGARPNGQPVGEYAMTRNVNNPNMAPGTYIKVEDEMEIPREIKVHRGHNGGPIIYYPKAVVVLSV